MGLVISGIQQCLTTPHQWSPNATPEQLARLEHLPQPLDEYLQQHCEQSPDLLHISSFLKHLHCFSPACFKTKTKQKALKIQQQIWSVSVQELVQVSHPAAWTGSLNCSQLFFTPTLQPVKPYLSFQGTPVTSSCREINPFLKLQRKSLSTRTEKYYKSHLCITNAFPQWQTERTQCFSVNHSLLHPGVWLMLLEIWPH